MDIKERLWAKTLLTAYPYLERAAEEADARLTDEAVSSWRSPLSAEDTCKRLMRIVAAKEGYINARVITNECVARLPQKLGRALKCRYFEMLSYPVIARVAGRQGCGRERTQRLQPYAARGRGFCRRARKPRLRRRTAGRVVRR